MLPGRPRRLVTSALMLGMFLSALEATAVAAAVPTAIGELGGVGRYSWVFSAYLLASTIVVPLYGKLADLYGRRPVYQASMALFLVGSMLCGIAGSFTQLVLFRAVQGLGAGGVTPVAATVIGDVYTLEERGRVQGLFSGVWALASLAGPLLGGLITDALSWRWIFFVNVPFGLASAWILARYLEEEPPRREHPLDLLGTGILTLAITSLLFALTEGVTLWGLADPRTFAFVAAAGAGLVLFLRQERRAPEPMLPLELFKIRLIAVASVGNVLIGALLLSLTAYVPLFAQGVLGGTAVDAGTILTPVLVGWPIASTISGRLLLRLSYRPLVLAGAALVLAACAALAGIDAETPRLWTAAIMLTIGLGMGFQSIPYFVGVQSAVPWTRRGVATSSTQFFRLIGGAVAVAALGMLMQVRLENAGVAGQVEALLQPAQRAALAPPVLAATSGALLDGLQAIYLAMAVIAALLVVVAFTFPAGSAQSHAHREPSLQEP